MAATILTDSSIVDRLDVLSSDSLFLLQFIHNGVWKVLIPCNVSGCMDGLDEQEEEEEESVSTIDAAELIEFP